MFIGWVYEGHTAYKQTVMWIVVQHQIYYNKYNMY